VIRGDVAQATLAAAGTVDVLVIGQQSRSVRGIPMQQAAGRRRIGTTIVAVVDRSPTAERTLDLAVNLAKNNAQPLRVLALVKHGECVSEPWLSWLQRQAIDVMIKQVTDAQSHAVVDFVRTQDPSVLLINRDCSFVDNTFVSRLMNECDCPLVLT
jgi:hypothetical protein